MPYYSYFCSECGHTFEDVHTVDDRRKPVEAPCPKCAATGTIQIALGAVGTVDAVRIGRIKPRSDFRERMQRMKKGIPKNNLKDY